MDIMRYAMSYCDTCSMEIPAGTDYVLVIRHVEKVERRWFRWAITIVTADVQHVWCLNCAPSLAEV